MKKTTFFLFVLLVPAALFSQTVEITPFGGYVFPGTWNASNGSVYFRGNGQYGGMVSIGFSRVMDLDFIYNRSDTKGDVSMTNYTNREVPLSINYFQIGTTKNFRVNDVVSPFVAGNVGGVLLAPKNSENYYWFFSVGVNAGAKIYFSKRVGIRLQAQMYIPVQGAGFMFYAGSGGPGGGVTLYSTLVQFGFTGGVIFRLGKIY